MKNRYWGGFLLLELEGKCNTFRKSAGTAIYSSAHQTIGGWATETDTDPLMEDVRSDKTNQSTRK